MLKPQDDRLVLIDQERSWIKKVSSEELPVDPESLEVWRMYYNPLRLRHLLKETGLKLKKMEIFFWDSIPKHQKKNAQAEKSGTKAD